MKTFRIVYHTGPTGGEYEFWVQAEDFGLAVATAKDFLFDIASDRCEIVLVHLAPGMNA